MPSVGGLYSATSATGSSASCCAASLCAICLLPPTMLMGATLPAIARWIDDDAEGRLVAGLLLRRQHRRARCSAACSPASICCASTTWRRPRSSRSASTWSIASWPRWLASVTPVCRGAPAGQARADEKSPRRRAERVRRDRALRPDGARRRGGLDAHPVADARGDRLHVLDHPGRVPGRPGPRQQRGIADRAARTPAAHRARRPARSAADGLAIAWTALHDRQLRCRTGRSIRRLPPSPWFIFQLDSLRCLWAILPAALLWGASFPLALPRPRVAGAGPGAARRRRLRGQYGRRHRRRPRLQPARHSGRLGTQASQQILIGLRRPRRSLLIGPLLWRAA